jgi:tetratricopeptide (TPR) repeat protein
MPPDAVEMTSMAVDIAESLSPGCYGEPTVLRTRGHAWREQAYALYFTGLYNEAITAVERARKAFAECGYSEFDEARAAVVFALICAEQENFAAGLAAAHAAADVFARYDTRAKIVAARRTEGITLYLLRRFREALTIYHALEAETITATERGAILQNIALCYRELGEFEAAGRYFAAAMDLFAKAGFVTAIAKSRWHFGRVLLAQGRYAEALDTLHQVREEFVTSNMTHDVAEVTTDIAHAMVVMGRPRDVADECRRALTYFASAGLTMTEPAMSAISLLQESAANDRLDARAVGEIRLRVVHSRPATIHLQVN